jgi:hypothetical protein
MNYPRCQVSGFSTLKLWPKVRDLFISGLRNPDAVLTDIQGQDTANASEFHSGFEEAAVERQLALILTLLKVVVQRSDTYEREIVDVRNNSYQLTPACLANNVENLQEHKPEGLAKHGRMPHSEPAALSLSETPSMSRREIGFDQLSLACWSQLLRTMVADIVLNEKGEPRLRWYRQRLQALAGGRRSLPTRTVRA